MVADVQIGGERRIGESPEVWGVSSVHVQVVNHSAMPILNLYITASPQDHDEVPGDSLPVVGPGEKVLSIIELSPAVPPPTVGRKEDMIGSVIRFTDAAGLQWTAREPGHRQGKLLFEQVTPVLYASLKCV
ncbi:hypothetical protein [Micromonospora sp. ATA51]|uniref:hypothetical protein n=1 Tax=Micromonospora sp. ATA51 TaxID=2806098 RepID=UPI001A375580|nr:hypothetical protein [Micromonospora sp. ATA51]MBM0228730.1 hypothetical protein [Micromonospora sp. ATA51]